MTDSGAQSEVPLTDPHRIVAGFVRALRGAGVGLPTGSAVLFAQALGLVGLDRADRVYWAGRATLIRRPDDVRVYDRVFASYWRDRRISPTMPLPAPDPVTLAVDEDGSDSPSAADRGDSSPPDVQALRYSAVEVLIHKDMAGLTRAEWDEARRLISAFSVTTELRPSRRTRPARRRSRGHPDLRGTVRRSIPSGGVPLRRSWRAPVDRPRRLVLLLDISGSMEPYARGLARFAHAAIASRRTGRVEVFALGTRLTRVTRELAARDPEAALRTAVDAVSDWSGGTRLGTSLREFNDRWGVRGMARGAIVVICSDGWDRGDPETVAAEMGRLSRIAHRVVWVNPLKASPGYAPLARGMAAALPFVDQFVEGHSVASLVELAGIVNGAGPKPVRESK